MTASVSRAAVGLNRFGRLWWLPPGGQGNGLDDQAWAPVLQISEQIVPQVLDALRDAGVPGYAARIRATLRRPRDRVREPDSYQLWVGASAYGRAEDALLAVMPRLTGRASGAGGPVRPGPPTRSRRVKASYLTGGGPMAT